MYLEFEKYLQSTGVSAKSIRNYKSDIAHFMAWAISKLKGLGAYVEKINEITPFLSLDFIHEYLTYMITSNQPRKTINRRLSTLRHLSKFLASSQMIDSDFMENVQNLSAEFSASAKGLSMHPSVSGFQAFLESEKVSKNTIKNYLSDIRQFMSWLESNHARFT